MNNNSRGRDSALREKVLDALALIHLSEAIFIKRSDMTPEHIAYDLLTFWLDRVYTPGFRYMEGFKGDRNAEDATIFEENFSEEEFDWLERFNRFLELRIDRLRPSQKEMKEFPIKDTWIGITRDAGNLIALMEPEFLTKKKRLDRMRAQITAGMRLPSGRP